MLHFQTRWNCAIRVTLQSQGQQLPVLPEQGPGLTTEPVWTLWYRNILYPCKKSNPVHPVRSPSLYWLSYITDYINQFSYFLNTLPFLKRYIYRFWKYGILHFKFIPLISFPRKFPEILLFKNCRRTAEVLREQYQSLLRLATTFKRISKFFFDLLPLLKENQIFFVLLPLFFRLATTFKRTISKFVSTCYHF
jgi:hypothetical protein